MSKLALIITTKTKPGKRGEVYELWAEYLKGRAAENAAQETYFFLNDNEDPDTFHLFEVYTDPAMLSQNATASWFGEYMERVMPLVESTAVRQGTPVWEK